MYQAPTEPLSIGQVLDDGFRLFRASFRHVWYIALIGAIAALPMVPFINAIDPEQASPEDFVVFFIALFGFALIGLVFYSVVIARIGKIASGHSTPVGRAFAAGFKRAVPFIVVWILYSMMMSVVFFIALFIAVVIMGVALGIAAAGGGQPDPAMALIGTIVGMALGMAPAAYIATVFAFAFCATVIDGMGPLRSLGYSFSLVAGHWWRTAAILAIIFVVFLVIYLLLMAIMSVLAFDEMIGAVEPGPASAFINYLIGPMVQTVYVPLVIAMIVAAYNELKLRHEGSDLAARIAALTS